MPPSNNRIALPIVLLTGALIGLYIWYVYFGHASRLFSVDFQQGRWITVSNAAPQGYFRKELHIPQASQRAWLKLAATDHYVLYINGREIYSNAYPAANVSRINDVQRALRPGQNVIGIAVRRSSFPGPAKVVLEGAYIDSSQTEHRIVSNASWKAVSVEQNQAAGTIPWYAKQFNADAWPHAEQLGVPLASEITLIEHHPLAITERIRGQWIGSRDVNAQSVVFKAAFDINHRIDSAWIRIAGKQGYRLAINGYAIAGQDSVSDTLAIYDVAPYLRLGRNTVRVNVSDRPAEILLDGTMVIDGQAHPLVATDDTWTARGAGTRQAATAAALGAYSAYAYPLTVQLTETSPPDTFLVQDTLGKAVCIVLTMFFVSLLWRGTAALFTRVAKDTMRTDALVIDGLSHLPCLLFLGGLYLVQFDLHFDATFPFQETSLYLALAILLVPRVLAILEAMAQVPGSSVRTMGAPAKPWLSPWLRRTLIVACVGAIASASLAVRMPAMTARSLHHDEVTIALYAESVQEQGTPVITAGPIDKPLRTYELLPYPIALSVSLFGRSDFAVRLPALMFSTLTLVLIFYVGYRLWGPATGLFAAAIYAYTPFALVWGTNAFHPQQTQFFALSTTYLFYRAIHKDPIDARFAYAAAASFIVTYLSWEPSGLLLLSLFTCLVVARGRDFSWIKSMPLWASVSVISLAVVIQQARRILLSVPYVMVGLGLSGATITLEFLEPTYDFWFYIDNYLLTGTHTVLSLLALVGLLCFYRDRGIRYYVIHLSVLVLAVSNLLPETAIRYVYFTLPFLILAAAAVAVRFAAILWAVPGLAAVGTVSAVRALASIVFLSLVFLSSNTLVLRLDRLAQSPHWLVEMLPSSYWIDYRSTYQYLHAHLRPGDAVIPLMPLPAQYYSARRADAYIQTYTSRQVMYDVSNVSGRYLDKFVGSPVLRNLGEIADVFNKHQRVWIVLAPLSAFELANDAAVVDYLHKNSQVVYETYTSKIYLWER